MEVCNAVEKEVEKVLHKFSSLQDHDKRSLHELTVHIQNIRQEISEVPSDTEISTTQSLILSQCIRKIRDTANRISIEHKDLHSTVSKVGKAIDRNFVSEFQSVLPDGAVEGDHKYRLLNQVVCEHFLRQGMLDIADELNEEAHLCVDEHKVEPFIELHRILGALRDRNLQPALSWAQANRDQLLARGSSLEFKLHRLCFVELLSQGAGKQAEALLYSRNFAPFASQHVKELQCLMGSLLFMRQGIDQSPYAHLLESTLWDEICDIFTKDACSLMGLSVDSPLSVSFRAGCTALPPLLNIRQVMQQRQCAAVWSAKDELPVEIDLGKDYHYHSIFACPILRQQSTDTNPPVKLICGHVISRDALTKLANGSKVKCPYCPQEQNPTDAKQLWF